MTSGDVVPGPGEMHTPVILIVEDEVLIRFSTAEVLREEGYVVLEAADGSEALDLMKTGHPLDLVLSDIRMPGEMDGLELSIAFKEVRPHLPVVLASSHLPTETPHCADGFLAKPYQFDELILLIRSLIGTEWQKIKGRSAS